MHERRPGSRREHGHVASHQHPLHHDPRGDAGHRLDRDSASTLAQKQGAHRFAAGVVHRRQPRHAGACSVTTPHSPANA